MNRDAAIQFEKVCIHEAAHARNMHHGATFTTEIERLAGHAAEIMLAKGAEVRGRWGGL